LKTTFAMALMLMIPLTLFAAKVKKAQTSPSQGSVLEGDTIFKKNCAMCHNADKSEAKLGPGLKGLFKNKELPATHKPATESNIRDQILKGSPSAKPMPMPAFADKLKPEELESLIKYLKTL
jgi:cytochrome c